MEGRHLTSATPLCPMRATMLLHLLLMRHAKSSWKDKTLEDHARPLNKRGSRDAPQMGRAMARRGLTPERILCSDARRAQQTLEGLLPTLIARRAPHSLETIEDSRLYMAELDMLRAIVGGQPATVKRVMLVGHNPGLEEFLDYLCGEEQRVTTCNLAVLTCSAGSWREATEGRALWALESLLRPRELDPEDDL